MCVGGYPHHDTLITSSNNNSNNNTNADHNNHQSPASFSLAALGIRRSIHALARSHHLSLRPDRLAALKLYMPSQFHNMTLTSLHLTPTHSVDLMSGRSNNNNHYNDLRPLNLHIVPNRETIFGWRFHCKRPPFICCIIIIGQVCVPSSCQVVERLD